LSHQVFRPNGYKQDYHLWMVMVVVVMVVLMLMVMARCMTTIHPNGVPSDDHEAPL